MTISCPDWLWSPLSALIRVPLPTLLLAVTLLVFLGVSLVLLLVDR